MITYGLVGFPLGHSFSKRYFENKFQQEGVEAKFLNFEMQDIAEFPQMLEQNPNLRGLSVTIPHKEKIIPFLDEIDSSAKAIGAVNSVKITGEGKTIGYNTDYYGFGKSLDAFLPEAEYKALILGSGGASKAVAYALNLRNIPYQIVSRTAGERRCSYAELNAEIVKEYHLIINTTPLGTFPNNETFPDIPYHFLTSEHFLFDLVYNPEETTFMSKGKQHGANVKNGYEMLVYQAERSWELWNA